MICQDVDEGSDCGLLVHTRLKAVARFDLVRCRAHCIGRLKRVGERACLRTVTRINWPVSTHWGLPLGGYSYDSIATCSRLQYWDSYWPCSHKKDGGMPLETNQIRLGPVIHLGRPAGPRPAESSISGDQRKAVRGSVRRLSFTGPAGPAVGRGGNPCWHQPQGQGTRQARPASPTHPPSN